MTCASMPEAAVYENYNATPANLKIGSSKHVSRPIKTQPMFKSHCPKPLF